MQKAILVVSPDESFLDQLRSHLEESGRFRIYPAATAQAAIDLAAYNTFQAAILDAEITDLPFREFVQDLLKTQLSIKLLIYPPFNDPSDPEVNGIKPETFLKKPFSTSEISAALARLFQTAPVLQPAVDIPLQESDLKRQAIFDSETDDIFKSLELSSAEGLVLLDHGKIISKSALVAESALNGIIEIVREHKSTEFENEIIQYLTLKEDTTDHLLFISPLDEGTSLALLFPPFIDILKAREDILHAKTGILDLRDNESREHEAVTESTKKEDEKIIFSGEQTATGYLRNFLDEEIPNLSDTEEPAREDELKTVLSEEELNNLDSLLSDMPSPDPENAVPDTSGPPPLPDDLLQILEEDENEVTTPAPNIVPNATTEIKSELTGEDALTPPLPPSELVSTPWERLEGESTKLTTESLREIGDEPDLLMPEESDEPIIEPPDFDLPLPWEENDEVESIEEAQIPPLSIESTDSVVGETPYSEPVSSSLYAVGPTPLDKTPGTTPLGIKGVRFEYTCIIIPKNPNQYIARDLAERLGFILPQLHLAYGWRMTGISVRPLYLLWTVSLPVSTCPLQVIKEMRLRTSTHFYSNFPELKTSNDEHDFWAPGFLVVSGTQPISINLIHDFIKRTRESQKTKPA